jgi:hypothetical protein
MFLGYRHRRRWLRGVLLFIIGGLAFMAIGLVINAKLDPQPPQAFPPTALPVPPWDTSAPAVTPPPAPGATSSPALTAPVHVVQGSRLVNGIYLGFPHTPIGAISAADAVMTEVGSTLDPNRAAAILTAVADPSFTDGTQQAAEGAVNDREALGLPASGPVPAGASQQVIPVQYQVLYVSADKVTVLLLADFVTTAPGQAAVTRVAVFPVPVHWARGDWKVLPFPPTDYSSLAAEPDSPQAAQFGWQDLQ